MVLIEIVYCKITGKTRDLPKVHHFIPLEPWEGKKIKGKKKRMKSVIEVVGDMTGAPMGGKAFNNKKEQIKLVLDMSNEGPMFKMLESMLGGAAGSGKGNEALKKLLKSGIPGLEGFLAGGADGFAKMSDEDKKRFLAAVTGVGGKIDGKAAAALIAAAASGGDPEIANKIIEKMMAGLGAEIDPSMMAALMATTALVARGASNEEVRLTFVLTSFSGLRKSMLVFEEKKSNFQNVVPKLYSKNLTNFELLFLAFKIHKSSSLAELATLNDAAYLQQFR